MARSCPLTLISPAPNKANPWAERSILILWAVFSRERDSIQQRLCHRASQHSRLNCGHSFQLRCMRHMWPPQAGNKAICPEEEETWTVTESPSRSDCPSSSALIPLQTGKGVEIYTGDLEEGPWDLFLPVDSVILTITVPLGITTETTQEWTLNRRLY